MADRALRAQRLRELQAARRWVAGWKKAGPRLERIRAGEMARCDVQRALAALEDSFLSSMRHFLPGSSSGLVEQQRYFRKLRT